MLSIFFYGQTSYRSLKKITTSKKNLTVQKKILHFKKSSTPQKKFDTSKKSDILKKIGVGLPTL